eukprot:gene28620-37821_t
MIKDKPDVVARFVKAYREAFDYVVAHPEEAAEITAKAAPDKCRHRVDLHQPGHQGPRPWLDDEMVILAAPGHPLAKRCATARQLADATWVLREHGSGTRQITDAWLLKNLDRVRVGFELGSTEAIKRVVASGAGVGCLSRCAECACNK